MQDHLTNDPPLADDEHFTKCREILAGVNAQGSYKRYVRAPHREFLRFRSLLVRGRAKTNGLNERIARLPNGACWKVLSYWREDLKICALLTIVQKSAAPALASLRGSIITPKK